MARKAKSTKSTRKTARNTTQRGRGGSAGNKRRKGVLAFIMPWMRRFGLVLGAGLFVMWAGAWLWLNGTVQAATDWAGERMLTISADAGFRVEKIMVEGRVNASAEVILAIINMQEGDPIFGFQPRTAKSQLEKISWVRVAHVERRLPDTLYIGLTERTPMALWRSAGTLKLLDAWGQVIAADNLTKFKDLMVVSGKGAPENFPELAGHLMLEPSLYARVAKAVRIGQRRWDIELDNHVTIKLPEEGLRLSLRRLASAHEDSGLLDKGILAIDLREVDRMAVRTKPGGAQDYVQGYQAGGVSKKQGDKKVKAGNNI